LVLSPHSPAGQLLLAGGGHTHALVLQRWLMSGRRPPGAITLVNRSGSALYSGMVPGMVAGLYGPEECRIDLRRLCRALEVTFVAAEITGLDLPGRLLRLAGRPPLAWDWLSLDVGAVTRSVEGEEIGVKPLEPFLAALEQNPLPGPEPAVRIRGGGAAAVELALALRGRGRTVTLQLRRTDLHLGNATANRLGRRLLAEAGVVLQRGASASAPATLACTGSQAPDWLAASGLPCDASGRVHTLSSLQVEGHPRLFASGDCAVVRDAPRPPSGVWAVRAAPTLAANLARCLAATPSLVDGAAPAGLQHWRPQRRALQLLADGSRPGSPRAMAAWGPLALGPSGLLWHWKDRIDRRFMARFQAPASMAGAMGPGAAAMACRGCAAKLAAPTLAAGLRGAGLTGPPEDAAVVAELAGGELLLQSVDGFPALVDDPWLNARLTTLHACSDLWACGAQVTSVQAIVTLPEAPAGLQEQALIQTLAGIRSVLNPQGASLVGGHSLEGRDGAGLAVSLSVNGCVAKERHWGKGPLLEGQVLLLTRPLGTGVLFAAAMAGAAPATLLDQALEQMQRSQAPLVPLLHDLGCRACTDITGFGLLGHLGEMLAAGPTHLAVELDAAALSALPGALELLEQGYASTLAPSNAAALSLLGDRVVLTGRRPGALEGLLIDPQTCGPLLVALPASAANTCLQGLRQLGFSEARQIGRVVAAPAEGAQPR
jgi:selenide,water dikinase